MYLLISNFAKDWKCWRQTKTLQRRLSASGGKVHPIASPASSLISQDLAFLGQNWNIAKHRYIELYRNTNQISAGWVHPIASSFILPNWGVRNTNTEIQNSRISRWNIRWVGLPHYSAFILLDLAKLRRLERPVKLCFMTLQISSCHFQVWAYVSN